MVLFTEQSFIFISQSKQVYLFFFVNQFSISYVLHSSSVNSSK